MKKRAQDIAQDFLRKSFEELSEREQAIVHKVAEGRHVSRNVGREFEERLTLGQRLADRVAEFGGSWSFIIIAGCFLAAWLVLNSFVLMRHGEAFDPYPYILLNLVLSMMAAMQAPVIMMSENRHASRDRLNAAHDYEVNLKAELEILALHQKVDHLREQQWAELIALQQEQIGLLRQLLGEPDRPGAPSEMRPGGFSGAQDDARPAGS
jgi:uncharacterized membrane protein